MDGGGRAHGLSLWAPVVIYMGAIFVLSGQSSPPVPPHVSDKLLHIAAYAGLALVICRALAGGWPARLTRGAALATFLMTVGYGVTDELHQAFVPARTADAYDLLADAAGAGLALIVLKAWDILGHRADV